MFKPFLKFESQSQYEEIISVLESSSNGGLETQYEADVVFGTGIITKTDPVTEEVTTLPGFHVNMIFREEIPEVLLPYVIYPENPACVWAE